MCGGDNGIRTRGLCLAKAALSQLSHIPDFRFTAWFAASFFIIVAPSGSVKAVIAVFGRVWAVFITVFITSASPENLTPFYTIPSVGMMKPTAGSVV